MAETILGNIIQQDKREQETAEEKVANLQALKPTENEREYCDKIVRAITQKFGRDISRFGITPELRTEIEKQVNVEINAITREYEAASRLRKLALDHMFGLGPLETFMAPGSTVTDIIVQRYNKICIKDHTGTHRVEAEFNSEEHLRNVISRIVQQVGRQINIANPAVDAKLQDGSRIHATIPPITPDGATLTIRRFNTRKLDGDDYIHLGTLTPEMLEFLKFCVVNKISILVSGGTDSGKTTLLNMLSSYIPDEELIITVEDNCELQLRHSNVRRMEARQSNTEAADVTIQDLVRHTLRMCPDRIIVGEVRDGTVVDMLSAMSVGHEGSMSTVHTDSPRALVDSRLPTLFSQYNVQFSRETQALMIAAAVQLIVQISICPDHKRRITHITAVDGVDEVTGRVNLVDLFVLNKQKYEFKQTKNRPQELLKHFRNRGCDMKRLYDLLGLEKEEKK